MDTRTSSTIGQRTYHDFIPQHRLVQQGRRETLVIELQGFRKEQIKVQIDKYGKLRISGERPLMDNGWSWSRFLKEYQVPENCNVNAIRAKFENGLLKINLPRSAANAMDATQVTEPASPPKDGVPRAGQEFTSQKTILRTTDEPDDDTDSKQQGVKAGEQTDAQKAEDKKSGNSEEDDRTETNDAGEKQQAVTAQANSDGGLNCNAGIYRSGSYWRRQAMFRISMGALILVGMVFYLRYKLRNAYTYRQLED